MIPSAEAYGPYDETKKLTVPKKDVPQDVRPGMNLHAPNGVVAKVLEVNDDSVVVDVNHPLAGKDLTFDVNIVNVEQPTKP
jgi:FKBP-type peptidyl-prolyl cis-trans isomerase 2